MGCSSDCPAKKCLADCVRIIRMDSLFLVGKGLAISGIFMTATDPLSARRRCALPSSSDEAGVVVAVVGFASIFVGSM